MLLRKGIALVIVLMVLDVQTCLAQIMNRASFPKGFVFGTASSAYQYEGAVKEGGRGPTVWDTFAHSFGKVLDFSNADVAVDQYHQFDEDIQLMKDMGMDAYRFSIAWSRIFPNGTGEINQAGVDHYNNLINALVANGEGSRIGGSLREKAIIPQSVCSRHGLAIGAAVAPFVRVLVWICFPVAYPISKLLDFLLGHGHVALFRRVELKTLVDLHGNEAGKGGELTHDETTIIAGALGLTEKTASDAMTPISDTFAVDINAKLDRELMNLILEKGHRRVPVYYEQPTNIIGLVLLLSNLTLSIAVHTVLEALRKPPDTKGLEDKAWRTKQSSVQLLGAMAYCAPQQLSQCLPKIVPKLTEVLTDTHPKVQSAGQTALQQVGNVIKNPEIAALVPTLLMGLTDPNDYTKHSLDILLQTTFINSIDAPSLALLVPIVHRGLRERSAETKKKAAQIVGNMCS
ncbi:unnamed protein product [Camellia sinensis]